MAAAGQRPTGTALQFAISSNALADAGSISISTAADLTRALR